MASLPDRAIAIDEEGFALSGEVRITDPQVGQEILSHLKFAANGAFETTFGGVPVLVEAFDEPLVAAQIDRDQEKWVLIFPYSHEESFDPRSLRLDEWDRFHGLTERGLPFALSRAAQASFFDLVDDSDDESVTIDGRRIEVPFLFGAPAIAGGQWGEAYRQGNAGWNLDEPAEALKDMLPRLKLPKCRVLVPGCGYGHDAALFAKEGHVVTAVDLSEEAVQGAKERYGHLTNLRFEVGDLFRLGPEHRNAYDLVFEHTLYCAIDPSRRKDLVRKWSEWMAPNGQLMGIFYVMYKPAGPPFGGTEWELRERLRKSFRFLFWGRWQKSIERRRGKELFVFASKL